MKTALKVIVGLSIVVLAAAGGLFGTEYVLSREAPSSSGDESGPEPTRVGLASPVSRTIDDDVTSIGTLVPIRSVELVPSASGRVTEVVVASGETVSAGDPVVRLDDRAARAALAEAEATLRETRQDFQRLDTLSENNNVALARREAARAAFVRAESAVSAARADLEDRTVTAPFDGMLGLIDIELGAYLDVNAPITRLFDLSVVEVEVSLPERYYDRIAPGQTVRVSTPAYPNERFEGRVSVRESEIDRESRLFDIRAEIDNPEERLVGGMFADTRVVFGTHEGLAIPDDAIISEGLTSYVFTIADGQARRTEISVGASLGSLTEVREGLSEGDRVVVAGWDELSDGAPVEIDGDLAREGLE